ncbi:MAG: hypothetical protein HRT65_09700 [Flavobacteriaceae bacterium]|nr:hypothetical protein [Flavobacteriaceae bacterium]
MPYRNNAQDRPKNEKNVVKEIVGLDTFRKHLERDFFAEATIKHHGVSEGRLDLVIELKCNFGLTESLFYLNNGNWGSIDADSSKSRGASPLQDSLYYLQQENNIQVDIEELSIHLRDTSIIITKIYQQSVADQLCAILAEVGGNFVHFTKGLHEMPYEIFVPVFEETQGDFTMADFHAQKSKSNYYEYWGLYFESSDESVIYDLKSKNMVDETDFFLLNQ